jgi:hypothetical protein
MELLVSDVPVSATCPSTGVELGVVSLHPPLAANRVNPEDLGDPAAGGIVNPNAVERSEQASIAARGDYRRSVLVHLLGSVTSDDTVAAIRWWSLQPLANRSRLVDGRSPMVMALVDRRADSTHSTPCRLNQPPPQ